MHQVDVHVDLMKRVKMCKCAGSVVVKGIRHHLPRFFVFHYLFLNEIATMMEALIADYPEVLF